MIRKITLFIGCLLVSFLYSQHKFLNDPKISEEDLKSTQSKIEADAPAEILYRSVHFMIDYNGYLTQEIVERVKIFNKDNAGKYLDHEIAVYDNGRGDREVLSNLKALTYNWEDGKKVSTKIERDEKFKSKEDKNFTITKFAYANVKNGSVVEYSYTLYSPFLSSTPRILIEEEIPVKYVEYVLDHPKPLGYSINYKGSVAPTHRDSGEKQLYGAEYQTYRFAYEKLPAFKDEKFVLNNNNYKTGIKAELNSTLINNVFKSYSLSWKDIQKRLYNHDDFGLQLKKENLVKNILPAEISDLPTKMEKANAILKFVQKNYTWNKEDDVFTDKGIKNLLTTKIGNTAEINLLLTMFLRSAGIDADPLVLSTVKRGVLLAYNPSISQLNFVLASFEENGKVYLLDGTSKLAEINMVSPRALNQYGIVMTKSDAKQVNVIFPEVSKTVLSVDAKLTPEGTFEGHFADRDTKLYAMIANENYTDNEKVFAKSYQDEYKFPFTNVKHGLQSNNDFETSFDFTSDTFVDAIGNKLVFNPLLFLYSQNHGYNQKEERRAPLEFYSAYDRVKKVTITIPDNYVFENVPSSKKFRTEDNSIQYSYVVTQNGNELTVETTIIIDDTVFPKEYYPAFKQIYDNVTKMEAQVVTVVKKK
ncbi:transglutaminase domain-containing protein [Kaistella sp.]|uniref:transglutaminase domain-containing protein n=1 Tax=Kaistella sp. TaxID=2782235 RepID=UPI003C3A09C0